MLFFSMLNTITGCKRSPLILGLCIAMIVTQVGCAHTPPQKPEAVSEVKRVIRPEKPEAVREVRKVIRPELGTIGVVSTRFPPETPLSSPEAPKAGGHSGAAVAIAAPGGPCVLLGAAVFALEGASNIARTNYRKGVVESRSILSAALSEHKIEAQRKMRDQFLSIAKPQADHPFIVIDDLESTSPEEEINYYASMAERGIDTILEMSLIEVGLEAPKVEKPKVVEYDEYGDEIVYAHEVDYYEVVMTLRNRLIRTADGELFYYDTLRCGDLKKRRFITWARNDAKLFEEEINRCYQDMAKKILLSLL